MNDHSDNEAHLCSNCLEEFCEDLRETIDMIERHPEKFLGAALVIATDAGDNQYVMKRSLLGDEEIMAIELAEASIDIMGGGEDKDDNGRMN